MYFLWVLATPLNFSQLPCRPNNFRVVDTFRKGRVFVAGGTSFVNCLMTNGEDNDRLRFSTTDAAHVHSPTGGQGLNSGVMDSVSAYQHAFSFTDNELTMKIRSLTSPGN